MFHEDNCISEDLNSTPRDLMPSFPVFGRFIASDRRGPVWTLGRGLSAAGEVCEVGFSSLFFHFLVDVQSTAFLFLFLFFLASNWLHSLPYDCGLYASPNSKPWRGGEASKLEEVSPSSFPPGFNSSAFRYVRRHTASECGGITREAMCFDPGFTLGSCDLRGPLVCTSFSPVAH